jgi:hypothetical protein
MFGPLRSGDTGSSVAEGDPECTIARDIFVAVPIGPTAGSALLTLERGSEPLMAANRLRALVSRIFTFAAEQRLVAPTANPVIGVKKPTKETSRDRVLTHEEIRRI